MLVEIYSLDDGSGMNSNYYLFKCYNQKLKLFEQMPFALIDEVDFLDCFADHDKAFGQLQEGNIVFNVPLNRVKEKAKRIYR